jgi:sulfopropanediol 3-dehydrogenase
VLKLKEAQPSNARAVADDSVRETVQRVIAEVEAEGDVALRRFSEQFDKWSPESFRLGPEEITRIVATLPDEVIDDIRWVQAQVRSFAQHQRSTLLDLEVETLPGVFLGHRHNPIAASGAYVPGGRYPLVASAHMTIVTAKVAGVPRVAACTPPIRGEIPAATVAAMSMAGADEIYLMGGVQAVAALALGTQSIEAIHLLAGPGNAYVAEAKRQLAGRVGIDLVAGPTEILVVADEWASPLTVAVDLLSQAEHGPESPAVLVTS